MQNLFLIAAQAESAEADTEKLRGFITGKLHGQEIWEGLWIIELGDDPDVIIGILNPVRVGFRIVVNELTAKGSCYGMPPLPHQKHKPY
jgi:hypothetical protein